MEYRKQLQKAISGLRPWEFLSVEQAMDQVTYGGKWYREPLGAFTTGPTYIQDWNEDVEDFIDSYQQFTETMCQFLEEAIPGFNKVLDKVDAEAEEKFRRRMQSGKKKIEAIKRARRPQRADPDDDNDDL